MKWLPEAVEDLERLHRFLADVSPEAAMRAAAAILAGADLQQESPNIGKLHESGAKEWFVPFGVGAYVLRYRLDADGQPLVIRVWHSREDRG